MNISSSSPSASVQVPARPADDQIHTVQTTLRGALARKYVVLVDCMDAGGALLSGVEGRLEGDLVDRGLRAVGDGHVRTFADVIVLVYGADEACRSIYKALGRTFSLLAMRSRPEKLTMSINGRILATLDTRAHEPSVVPRNFNEVLAIAREIGLGAELLWYGGAYTDALLAAGMTATYPMHTPEISEAEQRRRMFRMEAQMSRRGDHSVCNYSLFGDDAA